MPLHDDYARLTPFELAFPERARLEALAASATAEAARDGVDATDPDAFAALRSVGDFLAELHGGDVPRVELVQHASLLFHAVRFAIAGCPLYLADTAAVRVLIREAPRGPAGAPSEAGYLQLPQHLIWTGDLDLGPPESLDGLFWTLSAAGARLHALPIVGIRPDRPGFGALSVPSAPAAHAADWMGMTVRENGDDFLSRLPGADLDELYAVETAGEVLKLLARFFAHVGATRGSREGPPASTMRGAPRPSALPYTRVRRVA
jgi:hypothetical protein